MEIVTTYILKADNGKVLKNKNTGLLTPSVWLKVSDNKDDWEEIDEPVIEEEPIEEIIDGEVIDEN